MAGEQLELDDTWGGDEASEEKKAAFAKLAEAIEAVQPLISEQQYLDLYGAAKLVFDATPNLAEIASRIDWPVAEVVNEIIDAHSNALQTTASAATPPAAGDPSADAAAETAPAEDGGRFVGPADSRLPVDDAESPAAPGDEPVSAGRTSGQSSRRQARRRRGAGGGRSAGGLVPTERADGHERSS